MARKKQHQIFKPTWKDQFTFSLRERRGFYVLVFILAMEAGVLYYLRFIHRPFIEPQWYHLIQRADSLHRLLLQDVDPAAGEEVLKDQFQRAWQSKDSLFKFNPNECNSTQLKCLGLSERQAQVFLRYRAAGGRFRQRKDVKKVRVVTPELYRRWEAYIELPDTIVNTLPIEPSLPTASLDICTADSAGLDGLKRVSPFMAGRIVRFRNRLGGFINRGQLSEVYGMNDTLLDRLLAQVLFQCDRPERFIDLNGCPEDELRIHPYIGYKLARQIVRYRQQHPFRTVAELTSLPLVTPEIYRKLAPYLEVR